jgi:uncharacterized integral membrane protein (TIGR00698 family)
MKMIPQNFSPAHILIPVAALLCLAPSISSGAAFSSGMLLTLAFGNPYLEHTKKKITHSLLGLSVMGLGAGMNLAVVGKVGIQSLGYTVIGIAVTMSLGALLGRLLGMNRDTSLLITVGTAICGGSAIAALAPTIRAKTHDVSVSLGTVFLLNAVALFLFPWVGHTLHLSQAQFGLWSALAIHDTSSVIGATLQYGAQAAQIGTTVKLARALWIVPITFAIGLLYSQKKPQDQGEKPRLPWFILGFLMAAALVTWIPDLAGPGRLVEMLARRTLVLTLFLIGANLTRGTLKSVGIKPFIQGLTLWILVGCGTLLAILGHWIHISSSTANFLFRT